jgi:hypothetical protein
MPSLLYLWGKPIGYSSTRFSVFPNSRSRFESQVCGVIQKVMKAGIDACIDGSLKTAAGALRPARNFAGRAQKTGLPRYVHQCYDLRGHQAHEAPVRVGAGRLNRGNGPARMQVQRSATATRVDTTLMSARASLSVSPTKLATGHAPRGRLDLWRRAGVGHEAGLRQRALRSRALHATQFEHKTKVF